MNREFRSISLLFSLVVLAGLPRESKGGVVLASNLDGGFQYSDLYTSVGTNGLFSSNSSAAQEFQASASGTISTIDTTFYKFFVGNVPLKVSIYAANGSSFGSLIGSSDVPSSEFSSSAVTPLSSLDVSAAHINLVAGMNYFAVFTVADPGFTTGEYDALLIEPSAHSFGHETIYSQGTGRPYQPYPANSDIEIGLTIHAQSVPEPSSLMMCCLAAGVGLGCSASRHFRVKGE